MAAASTPDGAVPTAPRSTFACLWCGASWTVRSADDLEGYAQLCPDCLGKAGENPFLRFRLRAALEARAAAQTPPPVAAAAESAGAADAPVAESIPGAMGLEMVAYYEARAAEYDDWYLRRGRYAHGPIHDAAWNAELDAAGRWLDGLADGARPHRRARGGNRLVVAAACRQGRAVADGCGAGAPRTCARAPGGPRTARPSPRPRRVGRARGRSGRGPVRRVLAEPRRTRPDCGFPGPRPAMARTARSDRPDRLAGRSPVGRRRSRSAGRRTAPSAGSPMAASSRSSRSTARPTRSLPPSDPPASWTSRSRRPAGSSWSRPRFVGDSRRRVPPQRPKRAANRQVNRHGATAEAEIRVRYSRR